LLDHFCFAEDISLHIAKIIGLFGSDVGLDFFLFLLLFLVLDLLDILFYKLDEFSVDDIRSIIFKELGFYEIDKILLGDLMIYREFE